MIKIYHFFEDFTRRIVYIIKYNDKICTDFVKIFYEKIELVKTT